MIVHFFYSNKTDSSFYKATIEALLEEDVYSTYNGVMQKSFRYIEKIDVFISKKPDHYQFTKFHIEFGKDDCHHHSATSIAELYQEQEKDRFHNYVPISKRYYGRIRQALFSIYEKSICMDFKLVDGPQTMSIRLLDHIFRG
jgi:hypothetical protein